uniref:Aldehyde ferredoxin oxidoreductase N-terminal domain-containing protein n=1 Tax=Thermofilum pendens TaxID=2269 RepID=A0A7C3SPF3_THEPE
MNLGRREVKRLEIPENLYRQFIGGASIAAALFPELAPGSQSRCPPGTR